MKKNLILSIYPGADVLGMGFERTGFPVVRGPDKIMGGNNLDFHPPGSVFSGVIGGPPCQQFSLLNRNRDRAAGMIFVRDFIRTVEEAKPKFFLFENVANAPRFTIPGYTCQRFDLDLAWFSEFSRLRYFVFGSLNGKLLNPMKGKKGEVSGGCVTGNDNRSFRSMCDIQGLPNDFDLPFFTLSGKKQVIANAVPLAMSRYVAELIRRDYYGVGEVVVQPSLVRRCACGCGRVVTGRAKTASGSCRTALYRARQS